MKIFIDDYKPIKLLHNLNNIDKYFINTENRIEVYSDYGIYYINNNSFKEVEINDVPCNNNIKLLNFNLILDKSKITLKNVNHLPNNHISNSIISMKYSINTYSKIFMFIEGQTSNVSVNNKENIQNKYDHFIPNNFYFEFDEEKYSFDDCKNDLIVFLSLLK